MSRIINLVRHNFLRKFIALIVAFFMWVLVMEYQDPQINGSYTVPLIVSNAPYEYISICDIKNVNITVRAPRSYFVRYDANAFRAYANVEGMTEGTHDFKPQIVMPQGFELVETDPPLVTVKLDPLVEKQMPIEIITAGNVAKNAVVKDVRKSMDIVTLVGPKSFVERVSKVSGTLNLADNSASFETQVPLNALDEEDKDVSHIHVVPSVITVSVDIESGLKQRIVPVVPELSTADGWELSKVNVEPAQIEISGVESAISSIVTIKTVPFTVQTGQRVFSGTLKLDIPEGVSVKETEVKVSASIIRKPVIRDTSGN